LVFMDSQTYEQVSVHPSTSLGQEFLLEGQEAEVLMFEGKPVNVELPIKVKRKVMEAPEGVKGNTSTNVTKEVVIEGNVKIKAPLFIKPGDTIVIDTRDGSYAERG